MRLLLARLSGASRGVALGAAAALCWSSAASAAATKIVHYDAAHMTATATYAGTCEGPSQLSGQADAYRCHAASQGHYDPCYAQGAHKLACPIDLVKKTGIDVTVTALPTPDPNRKQPAHPWAMHLVQGQFCIYAHGYTGLQGYGYSCGTIACSAPTLLPLNTTYQSNCTPIASAKPQPRPFFVATIWK